MYVTKTYLAKVLEACHCPPYSGISVDIWFQALQFFFPVPQLLLHFFATHHLTPGVEKEVSGEC